MNYKEAMREVQKRIYKNQPTCECGRKMTKNYHVYGSWECRPCSSKETSHYHGTECHCNRCMGE
jgi:hypothetical protein